MQPVRGALAKAVAFLVVVGMLLLGGALPASAVSAVSAASTPAATSAPSAAPVPSRAGGTPADGRVWYGPDLDWGRRPGRLRRTARRDPSVYGVELDYPFDRSARTVRRATRARRAQGAVLVVSLEPTQSLRSLTKADAARANRLFEEATASTTPRCSSGSHRR